MLSRVADSLYWMSRYIERADSVARIIDVNLHLLLDLTGSMAEQWLPLVETTGDATRFMQAYAAPTRENVVQFLAFDEANPNSIISCVRAARENARSVREIITSDAWEAINSFYLTISSPEFAVRAKANLNEVFSVVKTAGHLFAGIIDATMSRGEGWHFCRAGRLLERADKTARILDVKYFILLPLPSDVGSPTDDLQWSALLRSVSAFQMYRQAYGRISPDGVASFLVLEPDFPRAVLYCVTAAEASLHAISGTPINTFSNLAEQRIGQLRSQLAFTTAAEMIKGGLHTFLDDLERRLNRVDDGIFETFFALRPVAGATAPNGRAVDRDVLSGNQSAGWVGGAGGHARDLGQ